MTEVTDIKPYDKDRSKSEQVEEMFDSIAGSYDSMNTAMTLGLHKMWRRKAIKAAINALSHKQGLHILDIATGTGDVAFALHNRIPDAEVIGIDLSDGMLSVARAKLKHLDLDARSKITFEQGDSLQMRFAEAEFDLITVAYGVRNFQQLEKGLAEMHRVLKPGGVLCIIELSEPDKKLTKGMYRLYAQHLIPMMGRIVSGDNRAYSYLPESIAAAPQREAMCRLMRNVGFIDCRWKSLTLGAVTYYIATR